MLQLAICDRSSEYRRQLSELLEERLQTNIDSGIICNLCYFHFTEVSFRSIVKADKQVGVKHTALHIENCNSM